MSRRDISGTTSVETVSDDVLSSLAWPSPSAKRPTTSDHFLLRKYQHLTRKHLSSLFDKLIAEYTGLTYRIVWATAGSDDWDTRRLPTSGASCCRQARTSRASQARCQACGRKQLERTLHAGGAGVFFECRLGVLNYWLPIRVRGLTVGIAYLQALDAGKSEQRTSRSTRVATGVLSRTEFRRGARLLCLIVNYLQTLDLADLRKTELAEAGDAVVALEREQARLHEAVNRHLPSASLVARRSGPATHSEEAVHQVLECISQKYAQPITLQGCARKLGMNAAYLSALFSSAVGVPFKSYLTRVRMLKAKALLGDFSQTVSEVSCAVGYSSENRFRKVFKQATGLAPKAWRATLRVQPLAFIGWLLGEARLLPCLQLPCLF